MASAWTTSRDVPGRGGITTSPWSPPPTRSSPNSAWPQKPIQRAHPLPDPRQHPGPAELLDRHLHHLPPPPAKNIHHQPEPKSQSNLTESYQDSVRSVLILASCVSWRAGVGDRWCRYRSSTSGRPGG